MISKLNPKKNKVCAIFYFSFSIFMILQINANMFLKKTYTKSCKKSTKLVTFSTFSFLIWMALQIGANMVSKLRPWQEEQQEMKGLMGH